MLAERAEAIHKGSNKLVDLIIENVVDGDVLTSMDANKFEMVQKTINFVEDLTVYLVEEATALDEINRKLDMLLSK